MRSLLIVIVIIVVVLAALWVLLPQEPVDREISFDPASLGDDLDAYFETVEGRFDDIVPGVEKRVVWAGEPGAKTRLALVYLHGFSATSEEIRPVPDRVAAALGANLIYTRLAGHGRTGEAMARATAGDWIEDTAEALAAARSIADEVLVMATSTGGTLAALAATDPVLSQELKGVVLVSPNFQPAAERSAMLTWPGARYWLPAVAGAERSFVPANEAQATYWTPRYPVQAVLPMAALVKHTVALPFEDVTVPALFLYSPDDQVVVPAATEAVAARWGAPATVLPQTLPPGNDPDSHVIAGDIMSPDMTAPVTESVLDWVRGLPE